MTTAARCAAWKAATLTMNISMPLRSAQISPWVGVRPFGTDDAGRFFGRSKETAELAGLWQRHRLTVLSGDSGMGKTSLLRAGVFPHLVAAGANVLPIGDPAVRPPMPAPATGALNPHSFALLASWQPADPPARVLNMPVVEFLRRRERFDGSRPAPTLVAVDQLHQISGEPESRRLLEELAEALADTPSAHLLVSMRTADLDMARPFLETAGVAENAARFDLGPLSRDAAIEAVVRPLALSGMSFEDGVAGRLVDEVAGAPDAVASPPGPAVVEPVLLQVAVTALWERLGDGDVVISTRLLPDAELTLASYCARVLSTITADHDLPTCEVGTWLRRDFVAPGGDRLVRPGSRPAEMTDALIRAVENCYLLTTVRRDGEPRHRLRYARLTGALQRLNEVQSPARHRDPAEWLHAAELALGAGDLPMAARHAQAATRISRPEHRQIQARAESLLGDIAYFRGRYETAERHYRSAIGSFELLQHPSQAGRLLAAIGELKLAHGDKAGALEELNTAVQRAPDDPSVQIGLGRVFWYVGRPKAALAVLDQVLRMQSNAEARRFRGEINVDLGRVGEALRDLDQIGKRAVPSARAARALALCIMTDGRTSPDDLEEIVGAAPGDGPVLLRAARTKALCGDPSGAAALASRAVQAADPPLAPLQRRQALELLSGE